jgi:aspartokinase
LVINLFLVNVAFLVPFVFNGSTFFSTVPSIKALYLSLLISTGLLEELEQLLKGVAMMKELTPRTRDYLVSFGECMSTRIFAAYLNKLGKKARQVHASSKCVGAVV